MGDQSGDLVGAGSSLRIGLVGCVSKKRDTPSPARELYVSQLFLGRRSMVERSCARWFILSAKHGLIAPEDVTAPYDQSLKRATSAQRRVWSEAVLNALDATMGPLGGTIVEIHAGAEYRAFGLERGLEVRGAVVEVPTLGLPIGRQLAFYKRKRDLLP
jgi:hypothetical protein